MRLRIPPIREWTFWHYQVLGWSLFAAVHYATNISSSGWQWRVILTLTFQFAAGFLLTLVMRWYYRRLPYQTMGLAQLVAQMVGTSLVITVIWTECWAVIEFVLFGMKLVHYASDPAHLAQIVAIAFPDKLAWSALYFGIKLWREWGIERDLAESATSSAHAAQLQALRYQLNPHFLFNALNAMRALIDEDAKAAKTLVTELSEFLRYSLVNRDRAAVTVREEMEAVRLYLSIEQRRYEDKLRADVEVDPSAEPVPVPAFTVHALVEHALRSGLRNGSLPVALTVRVSATEDRLHVSVRQSGSPAPPSDSLPSTEDLPNGLERLQARLQDSVDGRVRLRIVPEADHTLYDLEIDAANGELYETRPARGDR